jgi:thiamine pyrophosphokinase
MSEIIESYTNKFNSLILTLVGPLLKKERTFSEPIIFVDGGAKYKKNGTFGISVGDGDSFLGELDEILPQEKDFSDLSYVLNACVNLYEQINLLGFLGGRRDHELINFGEVASFLNLQNIKSRVLFDDEVIILSGGKWELDIIGVFSLISLDNQSISLTGACKYQVRNLVITTISSHGLSNIGIGRVEVECESALILMVTHN